MSQRYAFVAEWLDPNSGVLWRYQLFYYKDTNELEMVRDSNESHDDACISLHIVRTGMNECVSK